MELDQGDFVCGSHGMEISNGRNFIDEKEEIPSSWNCGVHIDLRTPLVPRL